MYVCRTERLLYDQKTPILPGFSRKQDDKVVRIREEREDSKKRTDI
jgi:hypothetical protein